MKIGIVAGDDIMNRLDDFLSRGVELKNQETGEPLASVRSRVQSANVYFGGRHIAEALDKGGQIIIAGRVTDTGLSLGPMIHEFKWPIDDWGRLAAGEGCGHHPRGGAGIRRGKCPGAWETES